MRVAVLTISDSVAGGEREDLSGPAVVAFCRGLRWEVVTSLRISDDPADIRQQLRELADTNRVDLIVTTGGTGLGPRDNTPEATQAIADRIIPGIVEEMRRKGSAKVPTALLSRAVAATRHRSLIVNVPGSPAGAVESLEAIAHLLPHAIHTLHGGGHDE
ncbi:MAG: MogA/MoaB family molybdenum cofactor biosynthesis protein [Candidatus Acidiferrum sp.]|jgi:molybdopterin adenylyltransferase